ncbi:MAG: response regulator transcription factor [Chloroflexi bacterium]|nr:response regulator transcription factor [Chloroflexota bacterium]
MEECDKPQVARILIVEDEPLFRELLENTLARQTGLEIIGSAVDGATAVQMARERAPDAVIMDVEIAGDIDGIKAALRIKDLRPETGIVILSSHRDRRYVTSLPVEQGAGWAYLLKQSVPDVATLVRAIYGSISGMLVLDSTLVRSLSPREGSDLDRLTARQRQVLQLVAQGYSNASVAGELGLAEKSVEIYINAIYQELGLSNEPGINPRVQATLTYLEDSDEE